MNLDRMNGLCDEWAIRSIEKCLNGLSEITCIVYGLLTTRGEVFELHFGEF